LGQAIAPAQAESAVSLVLVSAKKEKAYYQREEIAAAIDMARDDQDPRRVVPIADLCWRLWGGCSVETA